MENQKIEDILYEEAAGLQQIIENVMSAENASASDIAAALDFSSENLKERMLEGYKIRENYSYQADIIKGEIDLLNTRMKALKEREGQLRKKVDAIDESIKIGMQKMRLTDLSLPTVEISVRGTEDVVVDDEESVPEELRNKAKPGTPSKTKLKKYLVDNPDCDFAHMEKKTEIEYSI